MFGLRTNILGIVGGVAGIALALTFAWGLIERAQKQAAQAKIVTLEERVAKLKGDLMAAADALKAAQKALTDLIAKHDAEIAGLEAESKANAKRAEWLMQAAKRKAAAYGRLAAEYGEGAVAPLDMSAQERIEREQTRNLNFMSDYQRIAQ